MRAAVLRPPLRLWLRHALAALELSPRLRRALLVGLGAALLLAGLYLVWFRNSSLVRVERVSITGARGDDAGRMREALAGAARDMTTLHVDRDRLTRAVAGFSSVRTLEVSADFPHSLRIRVIEHRPVAMATGDWGSLPVAADGRVLRGVPTGGALPRVRISKPTRSERVGGKGALRLLRVAGGAPSPLAHRLADVGVKRGKGIVVGLRGGPDLIFGDTSSLAAKWLAATRVLADPSARGARYVDVRLPDRPAAGGLATGAQSVPPAASTAPPPTASQPQPAPAPTAAPTPGAAQQAPAGPAPTGAPVNPQP